MRRAVGWPLKPARTLKELKHYEKAYEVSDLYLWLQLSGSDIYKIAGDHVRPTNMASLCQGLRISCITLQHLKIPDYES